MAKYFLAHVDPAKELEMAFATFDKDKSGYIDIKELRYVLTHLGEKIPRKDVDKMFKDMDKNKDGKLDYKGISLNSSSWDLEVSSVIFYLPIQRVDKIVSIVWI